MSLPYSIYVVIQNSAYLCLFFFISGNSLYRIFGPELRFEPELKRIIDFKQIKR